MSTATATSIHVFVFVNRRRLELHVKELTGEQLLKAAGFGAGYDLFLLNGEGDPTGGTLIMATQVIHLKDGEDFRVIPGNRTFGA